MNGQPTRVLLIEDNPSDARLIQESLADATEHPFELETASTLASGLQRLGAGGVDALLLDLALPDSFGQETFIRARAQALGVAIIVLTGLHDDSLALKLVQGGAQDFVAKVDVSGNNLTRAILYAIERERLEREYRKLNEELEQRVKERTAELLATNKELEAFSYSVSHDLRNPLGQIHGYCSLLEEKYGGSLAEEANRYLRNIRNGAERMSHLIDDLIKMAKVSRQELRLWNVTIGRLLQEVLQELEGEMENRKITWRVSALPSAHCDGGLMKQVFVNLLSNAIKYTRGRDPAVIEVGCQTAVGEHTFHVRDNGVGFDMQDATQLFVPFQRLPSGDKFEGTGVGLATAQRIVEKHGGRIWAESRPGAGTAFYFTLPAYREKRPDVAVHAMV
jgi:two-component system sensor histidine kinase/response regulator